MELSDLSLKVKLGLSYAWSLYLVDFSKANVYMADRVFLNEEYFKDNLSDLLNYMLDKVNDYGGIIPYTEGIISTGYLSDLEINDPRISENYNKLYESLINATNETKASYKGYVLRGVDEEKNELLIFTKTNPIVSLKNMMITPAADSFTEPLLIKFMKRFDLVVFDGHVIGEAGKIEALFNMESTTKAICEANRNAIIESKVFNEASCAMLLNPRMIKSFQNANMDNVEKLKSDTEIVQSLQKYAEFGRNSNGEIDLYSTQACKILVKFISDKIVEKDGKLFEAGSLKPLEPLK